MPVSLVEKQHHDIYPEIDPRGKLSGVAEGKVVIITGAGKGIGEVIHSRGISLMSRQSQSRLVMPVRRVLL